MVLLSGVVKANFSGRALVACPIYCCSYYTSSSVHQNLGKLMQTALSEYIH